MLGGQQNAINTLIQEIYRNQRDYYGGRAMRRKVLLGIVICLMLVLAVGCGGSESGDTSESTNNNEVQNESSDEGAKDLVIVDSNYVIQNGYVMYTVAIENPNDDYMPEFAVIKVTGKKADGTIDFSDDWTISALGPGSTTYWASQAGEGNSTDDDTIDISVSVDSDNWKKSDPKPADLYTFDNVSVKTDDYGTMKATGEITLTDESVDYGMNGVKEPMIVCVLKDSDGKIVGGFNGYVDSELSEGQPYVFDIGLSFDAVEYDKAEMYANPWM